MLIQQLSLLVILIEILNLEWVVLPPSKILAGTPDDVVAKAIKFLDIIVASKARYKYVFPVPPGPSMKNAPAFSEKTLSNIEW